MCFLPRAPVRARLRLGEGGLRGLQILSTLATATATTTVP